ncbi:DUF551 domain-containing protein [Pseudomonas luteola]
MSEWISVKDKLPEIGVPVWLYEPGCTPWIGWRGEDGEFWLWGNCYGSGYEYQAGEWISVDLIIDDDYQPTHWQPLPDPPSLSSQI